MPTAKTNNESKKPFTKKNPCLVGHSRLVIQVPRPTADGICRRRLVVAFLLCQRARLAGAVRRWRTRRSAKRRPGFFVVVRIIILIMVLDDEVELDSKLAQVEVGGLGALLRCINRGN